MTGGITITNGVTYNTGTANFISEGSGETYVNLGTVITYPGVNADAVSVRDGGVFINRNIIHASFDGISAYQAGPISNSGTVYGGAAGINAIQTSVHNTGLINSASIGIINGLLTTNTGTITGAQDGIYIGENQQTLHSINNTGRVYGGFAGVYAIRWPGQSSVLELTNSGTIAGATYAVLDTNSGLKLTVLPGAAFEGKVIDTVKDGTLVLGGTAAATLDVSSFSGFSTVETLAGSHWTLHGSIGGIGTTVSVIDTTVTSVVMPGIGPYAANLTITNSGAVLPMIYVQPSITGVRILNDGLIGGGLEAASPVSLINDGKVYGNTGIELGTSGTISNSGLIRGANSGADLAFGTLTNSGAIYGTDQGVIADSNAYVRNTGIISATLDPTASRVAGVLLLNNARLVNAGGGSIAGHYYGIYAKYGSSVTNDGTVYGGFTGIDNLDSSLTNKGLISGRIGVVQGGTAAGKIDNFGTISGQGYGVLAGYKTSLYNAGLIQGSANAGIEISSGDTLTNAGGTITSSRDGIYQGSGGLGTAAISIVNASTIAGGSFAIDVQSSLDLIALTGAVFTGAVEDHAGDGVLILGSAAGGSLGITNFTGFETIAFSAGATWALEGATPQLASGETIDGFTHGDTIILDGFSTTSASYSAGVGLVLSNATANETLNISTPPFGFSVTEGNGNTEITAACFCRGTRIGTPTGEIAVEDLAIGDEILTLHAGAKRIKWIGRRSYGSPFADGDFVRPIRIRPAALEDDIPRRTLQVSPGHALYLGGALVPAWRLLNGASVTQAPHVELVEYFHIELDTQEVIFAEACPAESFTGAQSRGRFSNAAEYSLLYPYDEDQPPCLPLLEDGFALEAVKSRVARRAGLPPAPPATTGPLRGFVDVASSAAVEGWAQDETAPEQPVALDIFRAGRRIARILANRYRADLRAAGLGSGCHAFRVTPPPGEGEITVARTADGAILPRTDAAEKVA